MTRLTCPTPAQDSRRKMHFAVTRIIPALTYSFKYLIYMTRDKKRKTSPTHIYRWDIPRLFNIVYSLPMRRKMTEKAAKETYPFPSFKHTDFSKKQYPRWSKWSGGGLFKVFQGYEGPYYFCSSFHKL